MARLEADVGVRSTYYFRTSTFDPEVVAEVSALGHEVGYHYEDYVRANGDVSAAHTAFARNLERFRQRVDVRTVCAHGNPLSSRDNRDMWRTGPGPGFGQYDLLGEAYLSMDKDGSHPEKLTYCSDTGRFWTVTDPATDVATTDELIEFLEVSDSPGVYVLAHPSRWARSRSDLIGTAVSIFGGAVDIGRFGT